MAEHLAHQLQCIAKKRQTYHAMMHGAKRCKDPANMETILSVAPSNTGTYVGRLGDSGRQWETRGDKTRGKADTPSNTGTYVIQWETVGDSGRQGETRGDKGRQDPREGGHTIQYRHICDTVGDNRRQRETRPSARRTQHPIQAHMW